MNVKNLKFIIIVLAILIPSWMIFAAGPPSPVPPHLQKLFDTLQTQISQYFENEFRLTVAPESGGLMVFDSHTEKLIPITQFTSQYLKPKIKTFDQAIEEKNFFSQKMPLIQERSELLKIQEGISKYQTEQSPYLSERLGLTQKFYQNQDQLQQIKIQRSGVGQPAMQFSQGDKVYYPATLERKSGDISPVHTPYEKAMQLTTEGPLRKAPRTAFEVEEAIQLTEISKSFSEHLGEVITLTDKDQAEVNSAIEQAIRLGKDVLIKISGNRIVKISFKVLQLVGDFLHKVFWPVVIVDIVSNANTDSKMGYEADEIVLSGSLRIADFFTYFASYPGTYLYDKLYWQRVGFKTDDPRMKKVLANMQQIAENANKILDCINADSNTCNNLKGPKGNILPPISNDQFHDYFIAYVKQLDYYNQVELPEAYRNAFKPHEAGQAIVTSYQIYKNSLRLEESRLQQQEYEKDKQLIADGKPLPSITHDNAHLYPERQKNKIRLELRKKVEAMTNKIFQENKADCAAQQLSHEDCVNRYAQMVRSNTELKMRKNDILNFL